MLNEFLTLQLFVFLMLFCRIGGALMVLPGFGELFVSMRFRLFFGLMMCLLLTPVLQPVMPAIPDTAGALMGLIVTEVLIGVFIGALTRVLISAMHIAGSTLAMQAGLANGMMFDVTMAGQTTAVTNLLTLSALIILFAGDFHHLMLAAVVDSYHIFQVGLFAPVEDFALSMASQLNLSFQVAFRLAAPFIIVALLINLGGGVLSRLMPSFQVFFVLMPGQILLAFSILLISLPTMMLFYLNYMDTGLTQLLTGM